MASLATSSLLIFDGGIGTELYERGFYINRPFEELNLSSPQDVVQVHQAYLEAGAEVLTLNTFAANGPQLKKFDIDSQLEPIIRAALRNGNAAREGSTARLALSMGPLGVLVEPLGSYSLSGARQDFALVAETAVRAAEALPGHAFEMYVLETFTNLSELEAAIDGIRAHDRTRLIIASLSVKSSQREILTHFADKIGSRPDVEYLGLNCSEGPSDLLNSLQFLKPLTSKPILIQPNAGQPRHLNGRYFYMTSPDYLAKYAKRFIESGAAGVGGCCGTGPDHIRAIRQAVKMAQAKVGANSSERTSPGIEVGRTQAIPRRTLSERPQSTIGGILASGKKVISIEMNPPVGPDTAKFSAGVEKVIAAGFQMINVPDSARAMTRIGSLHLAAWVQKQFAGRIHAIPHFTTRDRNLIALQSDLLGAYVNGVTDVLMVTGDPPKLGNNRDATAVYDIDSIGLTYLADCLNRGVSPAGDSLGRETSFGIGVAANPTSTQLDLEIQRWGYKVESGADYAITQPIFDPESFLRWKDSIGAKYRPQIVGIWPLLSLRNAEFMANEVPGVHVPAWIIAEMEKAGDNKEEAVKRGIDIARRVMEALSTHCEGYCVSAPLGRVEVAIESLQGVPR